MEVFLIAKEYEGYKEELKKLKEKRENATNTSNNEDSYKRYANLQSMKIRKKIEELEVYLKAAENYTEIIKLMEENDEFSNFVKAANEKFGFTLAQCNHLKYMSINDFSKKEREKVKSKIESLKESLKMYEK